MSVDSLTVSLALAFAAIALVYKPKDTYARVFSLNSQAAIAPTRHQNESAIYRHRSSSHGSYLTAALADGRVQTLESLMSANNLAKAKVATVNKAFRSGADLQWRTMAKLIDEGGKLGSWLREHGSVQPQSSIVAFMLDDMPEASLTVDLACQQHNLIQLPLDTHLSDSRLSQLLRSLPVAVLIVSSTHVTRVQALLTISTLSHIRIVVAGQQTLEQQAAWPDTVTCTQLDDVRKHTQTPLSQQDVNPTDTVMLYAPVSSSSHDVLVVSRKCLLSATAALENATPRGARYNAAHLLLNALPLYHPVSRCITYLALYHGASVAFVPSSLPSSDVLGTMHRASPTHALMPSDTAVHLSADLAEHLSGLARSIVWRRMDTMSQSKCVPDPDDDSVFEQLALRSARQQLGGQLVQLLHTHYAASNTNGALTDASDFEVLMALGINVTRVWGPAAALHTATMSTLWDAQPHYSPPSAATSIGDDNDNDTGAHAVSVGAVLPHLELKLVQRGFSDDDPRGGLSVRGLGVCECVLTPSQTPGEPTEHKTVDKQGWLVTDTRAVWQSNGTLGVLVHSP
ncbi:medium-chain fatty acid-CoA ligase faa2 [Sorochytrium milnesiophthora]